MQVFCKYFQKHLQDSKKGFFFAAAFVKRGGKFKAKKVAEKIKKNVLKTFGSLKKSLTFAAALKEKAVSSKRKTEGLKK